jgi:hypothetical protein
VLWLGFGLRVGLRDALGVGLDKRTEAKERTGQVKRAPYFSHDHFLSVSGNAPVVHRSAVQSFVTAATLRMAPGSHRSSHVRAAASSGDLRL